MKRLTEKDPVAAIVVAKHPDGRTVYLPRGQKQPDTLYTLCQAGLAERTSPTTVLVHDPNNLRVICWQLSVNANARRLGKPEVFTVPADFIDEISNAQH